MIKTAKLIHNPGAGEGCLSKDELISMVELAGFRCSYLSVKEEGWRHKDFGDADFLIAAGGDGTVKKVVSLILHHNLLLQKIPIGLLPAGTANNIACALKISGDREQLVRSWSRQLTRSYDLSMIYGLGEAKFFIEGFGYGIFPYLVKKMKEKNKNTGYRGGRLAEALRLLLDLIPTYPARLCHLLVDGKEYKGKFLLLEVLTTPGIGPNLNLAPMADPGDGSFDVVMVTDEQREDFSRYVSDKLNGNGDASFFTTLKAKKVEIQSEDTLIHVDDELKELDQLQVLKAEILDTPLLFYT